jgi:hypothetical protein
LTDRERRNRDRQTEQVEKNDEQADAVECLRAIVELGFLAASNMSRHDAADPVPVQHDVDQDAESEQGDHAELNAHPVVERQAPQRPAASVVSGREHEPHHHRGPNQHREHD